MVIIVCWGFSERLATSKMKEEVIRAETPKQSVRLHSKQDDGLIRKAPKSGALDKGEPIVNTGKLAQRDIEQAILRITAIEDEHKRIDAINIFAAEWAKQDPDNAFLWATSLKKPSERNAASISIIMAVVEGGDLSKAESIIRSAPSGDTKDRMIFYSAPQLVRLDIDLAIRMASSLSDVSAIGSVSKMMIETIFESGKTSNIEQIISEIPPGTMRESIGSAVVFELSKKDPLLSLNWLKAYPEFADVPNLVSIAAAFSAKNPLDGIAAADQVSNPKQRDIYLTSLTAKWSERDPRAAGEWAISKINDSILPSEKTVFKSIAAESVSIDQSMIFDQLALVKDNDRRNLLTLEATKCLAEYNPIKSIEIALSVSNDQTPEQASAVGVAAQKWLARDSYSASKWIESLGRGAIKDSAVSALVENIIKKDRDFEAATKWAESIGSEPARKKVMNSIQKYKDAE